MKINVLKKVENKLMNRTEVIFEVDHAGEQTPARQNIKKSLSAILGADEKLIILDELKSVFGFGKSKGVALIYSDEKNLKKIEYSYLIKRNEPKKEAEAPKTEESPKEEVKSA